MGSPGTTTIMQLISKLHQYDRVTWPNGARLTCPAPSLKPMLWSGNGPIRLMDRLTLTPCPPRMLASSGPDVGVPMTETAKPSKRAQILPSVGVNPLATPEPLPPRSLTCGPVATYTPRTWQRSRHTPGCHPGLCNPRSHAVRTPEEAAADRPQGPQYHTTRQTGS